MNIYSYEFAVKCPNDGELIVYKLNIETRKKIMVEHIKNSCLMVRESHHEDIADLLSGQFPGDHTITAVHQGVSIKTIRLEKNENNA